MTEKNEENKENKKGIISRKIIAEMKESYLDYAMSVIVSRALPDVRDGLKPVHRRIVYTMHELGLNPGGKTRKSAKITGDVTGNYHPHGDMAVYDAMVNLSQPFSMRYPLIVSQGNFGSIDGDPPAASRYTEAKMSKIAQELIRDIGKDTVDWRPNYEGTRREPSLLPSAVPNLLLNGTLGIAVGMATNIPPHNLREISDAILHLVDNPKATTEDLLQFVKGPDYPTGAIAFNFKDIKQAYANGRGGVVTRGEAEIVEDKKGNFQIVITSIPYRVNRANLVIKIADLVRDKKLEGIKGLRDESTDWDDTRIVVELKGGAHPQKVLNYLYKHTQLEDTFHFNIVALVDGVPQTLSLKTILEEFIEHRRQVIVRRTQYDLDRALEREHILLGLKKALDHIDEIIQIIKKSKDRDVAKSNLIKKFKFSDRQTEAILAMQLQRLAGLERQKIEDELKSVQKLIKELRALLESPKKIKGVIKDETKEIADKYGDERRTKIIKGELKDLSVEDLVPDDENVLVLTSGGYIKRSSPDEFKRQKRGGVGVVDMNTKEEDFVQTFITTNLHSDLLFFTDAGKVYQMKMYDLPEGKRATKGKSVMNFLSLEHGEHVTSVLAMHKDVKASDCSVMMVTREGVIKKVNAESFHDVRRSGILAIKLGATDRLIATGFVESGESVMVATKEGQAIRFKESDIREMGRAAGGVRGIKLGKDDHVVGSGVISKNTKGANVFVVSENGYGKQTPVDEYKIQKRGGSGIKTVKLNSKTGKLVSAKILDEETEEVVAISKKSQVIRMASDDIPRLGRQTQGVRLMKLRAQDSVASVVAL
ncbi:MAG: DNA gyrase subunit A [Candidatus Campbellbacteria bacterium]|nr:DNA gyrase subunit A [Candidatus Campbellbacteria bacterium]